MAKKVDSFDWSERRGRSSNYDWDKWFDGNTWALKKGEDFTSKTASFRSAVASAAKREGKKVRTSVDGDTVYIQAYGEK